jgi:prepilin-type N-terminal cleavage/methylation domain-containing protein
MKTKGSKLKGFTLVELIVVIAIIGVLASILVPNMMGYVEKANVKRALSDAKSVQNVLAAEITSCYTGGGALQSDDLDMIKSGSKTGFHIDDPEDIFLEDKLGYNYTGIIYDFDYSAEGFKFAYTTKNLENKYKVYYNFEDDEIDSGYEIVDSSMFAVAKKKSS